jgi:hypothetical protein
LPSLKRLEDDTKFLEADEFYDAFTCFSSLETLSISLEELRSVQESDFVSLLEKGLRDRHLRDLENIKLECKVECLYATLTEKSLAALISFPSVRKVRSMGFISLLDDQNIRSIARSKGKKLELIANVGNN